MSAGRRAALVELSIGVVGHLLAWEKVEADGSGGADGVPSQIPAFHQCAF